MNKRDMPIGMIRHDELLNGLLAVWKAHYSIINQGQNDLYTLYEIGFEEALDAVAQIAGFSEHFEAGKNAHRAAIEQRLQQKKSFSIESPRRPMIKAPQTK